MGLAKKKFEEEESSDEDDWGTWKGGRQPRPDAVEEFSGSATGAGSSSDFGGQALIEEAKTPAPAAQPAAAVDPPAHPAAAPAAQHPPDTPLGSGLTWEVEAEQNRAWAEKTYGLHSNSHLLSQLYRLRFSPVMLLAICWFFLSEPAPRHQQLTMACSINSTLPDEAVLDRITPAAEQAMLSWARSASQAQIQKALPAWLQARNNRPRPTPQQPPPQQPSPQQPPPQQPKTPPKAMPASRKRRQEEESQQSAQRPRAIGEGGGTRQQSQQPAQSAATGAAGGSKRAAGEEAEGSPRKKARALGKAPVAKHAPQQQGTAPLQSKAASAASAAAAARTMLPKRLPVKQPPPMAQCVATSHPQMWRVLPAKAAAAPAKAAPIGARAAATGARAAAAAAKPAAAPAKPAAAPAKPAAIGAKPAAAPAKPAAIGAAAAAAQHAAGASPSLRAAENEASRAKAKPKGKPVKKKKKRKAKPGPPGPLA